MSDEECDEGVDRGAGAAAGAEKTKQLLRAKTCFFFFCDDARKRARKLHPTKTMAEISKIISAEWRAMSKQEKEPFIQRAKAHKREFEATRPKPFASETSKKLPPGWKRQIDRSTGVPCYVHGPSKTIEWYKPTASTVVPFVPKKAKTAYNFFGIRRKEACKSSGQRVPDLNDIAVEWRGVSETERAECARLAALDKTRYEAELRAGHALPDMHVQVQQLGDAAAATAEAS